MRTQPPGPFGGAPFGATNRVRGVPKLARWCHTSAAAGAFGGAPFGATTRARRLPKCERSHLGLSEEFPMVPRTVRG
eukprot:5016710-Pyramimonas_sp.AAC.1